MADQMMMQDDQPQEAAPPSGFEVCLRVQDGKLSVGVESLADEGQEGGEASESGYTPAESLKDALAMIVDLVKNGGQVQDSMAQSEFDSAYSGGDASTNPVKRFA